MLIAYPEVTPTKFHDDQDILATTPARQHRLRRKVVRVAADIDVTWAAMALAGALPSPSEYPNGSKRPKLNGHPRLTGEESDRLMVPELQSICEFQYTNAATGRVS